MPNHGKHAGNSGWTDKRVELLKKLWAAGMPTTDIAAEVTKLVASKNDKAVFSKNAVIGKAHTLKLGKHPAGQGGQTKEQLASRSDRPRKQQAAPAARRWNQAPTAKRMLQTQKSRPPKPPSR